MIVDFAHRLIPGKVCPAPDNFSRGKTGRRLEDSGTRKTRCYFFLRCIRCILGRLRYSGGSDTREDSNQRTLELSNTLQPSDSYNFSHDKTDLETRFIYSRSREFIPTYLASSESLIILLEELEYLNGWNGARIERLELKRLELDTGYHLEHLGLSGSPRDDGIRNNPF